MAIRHVKNTGSNTAPYDTWAKAATTLLSAVTGSAAGDIFYVSPSHTESSATLALSFPGTAANPNYLLCGTEGATSGITALATGAVIASSADSVPTVAGCVYPYGITFRSTYSGALEMVFCYAADNVQYHDNCRYELTGGATSSTFRFGSASGAMGTKMTLKNPTFKLGNANQKINAEHHVNFIGGQYDAAGSSPVAFLYPGMNSRGCNVDVCGFDFSAMDAAGNICNTTVSGATQISIRDSKLPAGWSGALVNGGAAMPGFRVELWNCDSGATNYKAKVADYAYSLQEETTIVKTGGASDGTTPIAWKMTSTANCSPVSVAKSPPIIIINESVGSSKTATIEFVHDTNVTAGQGAGTAYAFQDNEVWIELEYLGSSGSPISSLAVDRPTIIATPADQTSSSATWTTTGITTPVKQSLSVTFTPQMKGALIARVCMAKPSKTIYIDPLATVA
jgi:hypothetical protein